MTTTTTTTTTEATRYIVVLAPGHYHDRTVVISAHRTLAQAKRACTSDRVCVREAEQGAGDEWLTVYEQMSPIVYRRLRDHGCGSLMDYGTAEYIRPATHQERQDSRAAAERDGGVGVIIVGAGRRCYVQE